MRLKITFEGCQELRKVKSHHVQGWLYEQMDRGVYGLGGKIHDGGIRIASGRIIKPFVFSRLWGDKKTVNLKVSTADPKIAFALVKSISEDPAPLIGDDGITLWVKGITFYEFKNTKRFFTLSPLILKDNHGWCRLSDPDAVLNVVNHNLKGKYEALYGEPYDGEGIKVFKFERIILSKLEYKGYVFQGVDGPFLMVGDERLIKIAYDCGLGAKNACGFGCIESTDITKEKEDN
ncbi:MAG: CRISPR-associated endoribonuclease Cas6 [Dictyoglomus turgidum]